MSSASHRAPAMGLPMSLFRILQYVRRSQTAWISKYLVWSLFKDNNLFRFQQLNTTWTERPQTEPSPSFAGRWFPMNIKCCWFSSGRWNVLYSYHVGVVSWGHISNPLWIMRGQPINDMFRPVAMLMYKQSVIHRCRWVIGGALICMARCH